MELKEGKDQESFFEELNDLIRRGEDLMEEHSKHPPDPGFPAETHIQRLKDWSKEVSEKIPAYMTSDLFSPTVEDEKRTIRDGHEEVKKEMQGLMEPRNAKRIQDTAQKCRHSALSMLQKLALFREVLDHCDRITDSDVVDEKGRSVMKAEEKERFLLGKLFDLGGDRFVPMNWFDEGNGLAIGPEELDELCMDLSERDEVEHQATSRFSLAKIKYKGKKRVEKERV